MRATTRRAHELTLESVPTAGLRTFHKNPRQGNVAVLVNSLRVNGQYKPIVVNRGTHTGRECEVLAGNHTLIAAREAGWEDISVVWVDVDEDHAARIVAADNRVADLGTYDEAVLADLLGGLPSLEGTGYADSDLAALLGGGDGDASAGAPRRTLAERFGVPPFSVLDARQGYWRERKQAWIGLGLRSEVGRGADLLDLRPASRLQAATRNGPERQAVVEEDLPPGTSVFDPVLTELLVRWYSAPGHRVLDPFAGGSVRGLVSARLGRSYTGVDLRPEQVAANEEAAADWLERGLLGEEAPEAPASLGPDDLTPVELHGGHWVKRDDLFAIPGGAGGKVRTCLTLARGADAGLITAGSRQSPQVNIVAGVAAALGLPCRVHVPAAKGGLTPELAAAQATGAEIVEHRPGHNSVIIARAREDAAARGWTEIPFGMECAEAVAATAAQVANLPADAKRLVVPVGSGMSLAGILSGLAAAGRDLPVLGVKVGADPSKRLDRYAPGWRERAELLDSPLDYHQHAPVTELGALRLDPVYEAKCLPFLQEGDVLWVVGCRETELAAAPAERPRWLVGDSRNLAELLPAEEPPADLLLTCPPYFDLEVYSDDPADLSRAADYAAFLDLYGECLAAATARMAPSAFAAIVTGAVRDKRGMVLDLPADTTRIMERLGWRLYQDAMLVTPVGSASVRASRYFTALRKLVRVHQSVAVYHRGELERVRAWPTAEAGEVAEPNPDAEAVPA